MTPGAAAAGTPGCDAAGRGRLRVLHLCPDPTSRTGIGAYAASFREGLTEAGAEVGALPVPARANFGWAQIRGYALAAARRASSGFDIVHVELAGGSLYEFYAARALCKRRQVPVWLTVHDPPGLVWSPFAGRIVRESRALRGAVELAMRSETRRMEQSLVDASAGVFVLSPTGMRAICEQFPGTGTGTGKIVVLPYPSRRRAWDAHGPERSDELTVGFYGHWYVGKGIETLIAAVARTRDDERPVRARLFGEVRPYKDRRPGERYGESVIRQIERSGAQDQIERVGFVPEAQLAAALSACDAIVLPYVDRSAKRRLASVSAAAFDALSAGTPVIASDVRAIRDVVTPGHNGLLFPSGDVDALTAILRRLRDDDAVRSELRAGARQSSEDGSPAASGRVALSAYLDGRYGGVPEAGDGRTYEVNRRRRM